MKQKAYNNNYKYAVAGVKTGANRSKSNKQQKKPPEASKSRKKQREAFKPENKHAECFLLS